MSEELPKKNDWKRKEIAAVWKAAKGYSGKLNLSIIDVKKLAQDEKLTVFMYPNDSKNAENNQPDYHLYLTTEDVDRLQGGKPAESSGALASTPEPAEADAPVPDLIS